MSFFLVLAFLFFIGSSFGWCLEVLFRRFFSKNNPERKWINPGFCTGPYLPLYGFGLSFLYVIAIQERHLANLSPLASKLILFAVMAVCMTVIEYIAGILSLKVYKVRLWDYSKEWGNIQGIICPKFSLAWAILGALYYFLIHPHILDALAWLAQNLAFSFFIGVFYGVFIIDVVHATQIIAKLKEFAEENDVIVRFEAIKTNIRDKREEAKKKYRFFQPFKTDLGINEHLKMMKDQFEKKVHAKKAK